MNICNITVPAVEHQTTSKEILCPNGRTILLLNIQAEFN